MSNTYTDTKNGLKKNGDDFTLEEVLKAYLSCRKNKRNTINQIKFELNLEENIFNLYKALNNGTYYPGRSICFVVTYPKLREIFAADFKDRVIHHLLVSRIEGYFEKRFIFDSYACRVNKGVHKAIERLNKFEKYNKYYLSIDIKSFFSSIDKNILYSIIVDGGGVNSKKIFLNKSTKYLLKIIIFYDPTLNYCIKGDKDLLNKIPFNKSLFRTPKGKGLPIGNLTSQFFGNVYLNQIDQYIKRTLKVRYYIRYVDDLILLSNDKNKLLRWREDINNYLINNLKLELNKNKDKLGSVKDGINFLGYIIRPNYKLSRRRVVSNLKNKLYFFNKGYLLSSNNQKQIALPLSKKLSNVELNKMLATINSYYGHFKHANTYRLRRNLYIKFFGNLKKYLVPVNKFRKVKNAR